MDRIDEAGNEFPRLWQRFRKSKTPQFSRILSFGMALWRVPFKEPVWLSKQTVSVREIRYRREKDEHIGIAERFHRRLHYLHSIEKSAILFAVCQVTIVGACLAYGLANSETGEPGSPRIAAPLIAIAGVLAGVAGMLFAVIVFGMQFHGERLGLASFLVRYLGRREGLVPIAAVTLSVISANAIVALFGWLWLPKSASCMATLDIVLVPSVLLLSLWLLHRIVASVSGDYFERSLIPGLLWEFERALDEEAFHGLQSAGYLNALQRAGLAKNMAAGMTMFGNEERVEFKTKRIGCIADINLSALKRLGRQLAKDFPGYEPLLTVGPDDTIEDPVIFVLRPRRNDAGNNIAVLSLDEQARRCITGQLNEVFIVKSPRERDVADVLSRFSSSLAIQAKQDLPSQFSKALEVLEHLIEAKLKRKNEPQPEPSFFRSSIPDFLGSYEYYEWVRAVIATNDYEKVEVLLRFSARLMRLAIDYYDAALFRHAGNMYEAVYSQTRQTAELATPVSDSVDSWLHAIMEQFSIPRHYRPDLAKVEDQMPVLVVAIGWNLRLVKRAIDAKCAADAYNFHDRLFEWDEHEGLRRSRIHRQQRPEPVLENVLNLHYYAEIVMAAWCLHVVGSKADSNNAASTVLQSAKAALPTREELVEVWEWVDSSDFGRGGLNTRWNPREWPEHRQHYRVGKAYPSAGEGDSWVKEGFVAMMLVRSSAPAFQAKKFFSTPPKVDPLAETWVEEQAKRITSDDWISREVLGIADEKKGEAVSTIKKLFASRRCSFKLEKLRQVVCGSVSKERVEELRKDVLKKLPEKCSLVELLESVGLGTDGVTQSIQQRAIYDNNDDKGALLDTTRTSIVGGAHIADYLINRENTVIAVTAEETAKSIRCIAVLSELPAAAREASQLLSDRGFKPSLIVLPRQGRFPLALTGKPRWQIPSHGTLGGHHIGTWEELEIVECPYTDPESIVVMDAAAFFGNSSIDRESALSLSITEPYTMDHQEWLTAAEKEKDPSKIPETYNICVRATAQLVVGLGVRNCEAAGRIDINLANLGYAMQGNNKVYHRPDCRLLDPSSATNYSLYARLPDDKEQREPCEECDPTSWDRDYE